MRKANRKKVNGAIYARLADIRINEHERQRAAHAIQDAEAIVDAIIWIKERIASVGAMLLRPGFKH